MRLFSEKGLAIFILAGKKDFRVIIYGAGDVGQSYMNQLSKNSFCKVVSWVDNECKKFREFGLSVVSPSKMPTIDYDKDVIAVSSQRVALEINAV